MIPVGRAAVEAWIAAYVRLWRAGAGQEDLLGIFTPDATYRHSPLEEPVAGIAAIAVRWAAETEPGEQWTLTSEVVAVEGATAVARLDVRYTAPETVRYLDLWVLRFAPDGRCLAFEEWWWADRPAVT